MTSLPSILCFGELVVDCFGNLIDGFVPKFGGAPGNTAIGLTHLGVPRVYMHAMVGDDFFGEFLIAELSRRGVHTSQIHKHPNKKTTLAFVSLASDGQRSFVFYEGAHPHVTDAMIDEKIFFDARFFHFGSLTQATDEGRRVTARAVALARAQGAMISYDPNVRLALWKDHDVLRSTILETIPSVDLLKINEEEAEFLSGEIDPARASKKLWHDSLSLLVITLGARGAYYKTKNTAGFVETVSVFVVDTTGAGDACNAGLLYQLYQSGKPLSALTDEEMRQFVRFAVVFASLSTTQKGAVQALPTREEVEKHLAL